MLKRYSGKRICADLGAAQRVLHWTFLLFFFTFSVFVEPLTLWGRAHLPLYLALPFGPIFHASKETQLPLPWPARPRPGKRHWVLVASAAMAGHAFAFSAYQGCHRGPSCTRISGLDLGTHCRQLCREAERKWREMTVCPSPCVYWGNRCINKSETPGRGREVSGLAMISGRVRVQNW